MAIVKITGLKTNTTYSYVVQGIDSKGNKSQTSRAITFTTPKSAKPSAMKDQHIQLRGGSIFAGSINFATGNIVGPGVSFNQYGLLGQSSAGQTFKIDSSTGDAFFAGTVTASAGNIGGFSLKSNSLSAINIVLSSSTGLNLGNGVFSVDQNGNLIANSASIKGSINATSGSFTGAIYSASLFSTNIDSLVLNSSSITGGYININNKFIVDNSGNASATSITLTGGTIGGLNITTGNGIGVGSAGFYATTPYSPTEIAIYAGSAADNRAIAPFRVDYSGNMVAQNASITGNIIAKSGSFTGAINAASMYGGYLNINGNASISGYIVANSGSFTAGLYASVGTIGGFNISSSSLSAGTGATTVGLVPGTYPFFAGNATPSNAPFKVDNSGNLVATSASITGNIVANSGSFNGGLYASVGNIGGWTVASTQLTSASVYINSQFGYVQVGSTAPNIAVMHKDYGFYAGSANADANTPFWVDLAGNLRANSASIRGNIVANSGSFLGAITASVGKIGGFTLQSNSLSATNIVISSTTGLNYGPNKFIVDNLGNASALSLYASSGLIAGDFQVTGTIYGGAKYSVGNGIQIDSTGIYGYNGSSYRFFLPTDALTDPYITKFQIIEAQYTGSGSRAVFVIGSPATGQSNITINGDKVTNPNKPAEIKSVINGIPTSSATGNGFYFDDAGRFRIAADSNNYISGQNGNLFVSGTIDAASGNFRGTVTASVGKIGGFTLDASRLYATNIALDSNVGISLGTASQFIVTTTGNASLTNIFASGTIIATSGSFNGGLYASVGKIAGFTLSASTLFATNIGIDSTVGIALGSASQFIVTTAGNASLTSMYAQGTIVSNSGSIGGISIGSGKIFTGAGTYGNANTGFYAASNGQFSLGSGLTWDGSKLTASGTIIATSGSFTGALNSASLYSGILNINNKFIVDSSGNASVNGNIIAQSGSFTGALSSSVGYIGNWTLDQQGLQNGSVGLYAPTSYSPTEIAIFAGSAMANRATAPFRVDYRGNMVANNASITGYINANSGSFTAGLYASAGIISGFNIKSRELYTSETSYDVSNSLSPYSYIGTTGWGGYAAVANGPGYYTTGQEESSASGGVIFFTASTTSGNGRQLVIDPYGISWFKGVGQYYLNRKSLIYDGVSDQFRIMGAFGDPGTNQTKVRFGFLLGTNYNSNTSGGLSIISSSVTSSPLILRPHSISGTEIASSDLYYGQSASTWYVLSNNFYSNTTANSIDNSNTGFTARSGLGQFMGKGTPLILNHINFGNISSNYIAFYANGTSIATISAKNSTASNNLQFTSTGSLTLNSNANATYLPDANSVSHTAATIPTMKIDSSGKIGKGFLMNSGQDTTPSTGSLTVSHGLGTTPTAVVVSIRSNTPSSTRKDVIYVGNEDSNSFSVYTNDGAGNYVARSFSWIAMA